MRILFVDDDLTVLDDMRRQVHGKKNFQASYAASVDEGLAFIEHDPIDVLVTALRMPKKDGVVLLEAVQEKRPACVRIVFTSESNTERFFRCVPLAHRMVSKPCVPETLIQLVEQTFELRRRISDPRVMRALSGIGTLPPQPRVYMEIEKALKTDKSLQEIGQLVARDQAITVKILQLVNSAWFPTRRRIDSCQQAVAYLGSAHTKSLVLSLGTACEMSRLHPDATQAIDAVGEHAEQVAGIAQRFAQALGLSRDRQEEVFCAAILHDIGKLLVITGFPDIAKKIEERAKNGHAARLSAERGLLEATHA